MHIKKHKSSKGFSILSILLVITAIVISVSVWTISGSTNNEELSKNSTDVLAMSVINDGTILKSTFDRYQINGVKEVDYYPTTRSYSPPTNLLDPLNGVNIHKANPRVIKNSPDSNEGFWVSMQSLETSLGTPAPEIAMVLGGVKHNVCKRINQALHGQETIPDLGMDSNNFLFGMGISFSNPVSSTMATLPATASSWTSGCLGTPSVPDGNLYFVMLEIK